MEKPAWQRMRAFHSLLRAADRPGHGRADVGCGQIGLEQQHARDGRQHELLPAGAVIRQCVMHKKAANWLQKILRIAFGRP